MLRGGIKRRGQGGDLPLHCCIMGGHIPTHLYIALHIYSGVSVYIHVSNIRLQIHIVHVFCQYQPALVSLFFRLNIFTHVSVRSHMTFVKVLISFFFFALMYPDMALFL